MKTTLVQMSVRDLHFLFALLANTSELSGIPEVEYTGTDLQNEHGVFGLMRKIADAHDGLCVDGVKYVPIVADLIRQYEIEQRADAASNN